MDKDPTATQALNVGDPRPRCCSCHYFQPTMEVDAGQCRFTAPQGYSHWPIVRSQDWCGRYKTAE